MARLIVLGLLRIKPMSGYEMQQVLQESNTEGWANVLPGSIYHALKKMEKEGLVEIDTIEQTGHRIKAIYKITDKGEEEFQKLLKESLTDSSVTLPSTLYSGLSFIQSLSTDEVLAALSAQKEQLEKELMTQKEGIEIKRKYMPKDEIGELIFQNYFKQYELQIEFLESLIVLYK